MSLNLRIGITNAFRPPRKHNSKMEVERLALNEKMMIEVLYEVLSASF